MTDVKALFVAYGNGINPAGMQSFDELAVVGSCAAAGQQDVNTIVQELQKSSQLSNKKLDKF